MMMYSRVVAVSVLPLHCDMEYFKHLLSTRR